MEFGMNEVVRCPSCRFIAFRRTFVSGNTAGAEFWSDGYVYAPSMQDTVSVIYCPLCREWTPAADWKILFSIEPKLDAGELPEIETDPSLEELAKITVSSACSAAERETRTLYWHKLNHRRRFLADGYEPELGIEYIGNLEQLMDLLGPEDRLVEAEIFRELGDFTRCEKILEKISGDDAAGEPFETIQAFSAVKSTMPVRIGSRPMEKESEKEAYLRKMVEKGFYPFPSVQDLFAFPSREKEKEHDALLAVEASSIFPGTKGWLAFFFGEKEFRLEYGRLFLPEEWDYFNSLSEESRMKLKLFWGCNSWALPENETELEEYYKILFQLYYGADINIPRSETSAVHGEYDPLWEMLTGEELEAMPEVRQWIRANPLKCYWDYFWKAFTGEDLPYCNGDLFVLYHSTADRLERLRRRREIVFRNLESVKLGGAPGWFQGLDMTPEAAGGGRMQFVGQFWTDDIGFSPSMLVYLFFDPESHTLKQIYDYD